jgi:hypothetical protein
MSKEHGPITHVGLRIELIFRLFCSLFVRVFALLCAEHRPQYRPQFGLTLVADAPYASCFG